MEMKRAFLCNVRESSASRASVGQVWLEGGNITTTVSPGPAPGLPHSFVHSPITQINKCRSWCKTTSAVLGVSFTYAISFWYTQQLLQDKAVEGQVLCLVSSSKVL